MTPEANDPPIYMLNALWFKPDGGERAYRKYLGAVQKVVEKYGGRKLDSYLPDLEIIGNFDANLIFFVEWPSWEIFQRFLKDDDFLAVRHLREEALEKSLLIRCQRTSCKIIVPCHSRSRPHSEIHQNI